MTLDAQNVYQDDGALIVNDWDQAGTEAWGQIVTAYDAAGRLDWQAIYYDDGRRMETDWDALNQHAWASQNVYYTGGVADYRSVVRDDQRVVNTDWDLGGLHNYWEVNQTFLPDGRQTEDMTWWDNGTARLQRWDVLDEQRWDTQRVDFYTNGKVEYDFVTFDDRTSYGWSGGGSAGQPLGVNGLFDAGGTGSVLDDLLNDSDWAF